LSAPRRRIAFGRINASAVLHCEAILGRWLPGGKVRAGEYVVRNPKRADHKPGSFSINLNSGRWADFATSDGGGDLISLAAYLFDLNQAQAANRVAEMLGENPYE
jgi:hypothetical protein